MPKKPGSGKKPKLPKQTGELEEYMYSLISSQQSQACEREAKYIEADMAKRRLQELKKDLEDKSKSEIVDRHQQEKQEVESAQLEEFNKFNEFWDQKMEDFQQEVENVKQQTLQRQEEEMNELTQEMDQSLPNKPKDSPEILSLRKQEEILAKAEEYMAAYAVQQKILALEREDQEKWQMQRSTKMKNVINQLKLKHNNELRALEQRIESGKEEQRKVRSQELEKLLQKYQNVVKGLDSSQNQELNRLQKAIKNQCNILILLLNASCNDNLLIQNANSIQDEQVNEINVLNYLFSI